MFMKESSNSSVKFAITYKSLEKGNLKRHKKSGHDDIKKIRYDICDYKGGCA